jgi:hypothetical protein
VERSPVTAEGEAGLQIGSYQSPQALLLAFRQRFLPHVDSVAEGYDQLERNFEYAYRRRNLRQTFVMGLLIALAFNLPLQRLWRDAAALSPQQAVELAEKAKALYDFTQTEPKAAELLKKSLDASVVPVGSASYRPVLGDILAQGAWPTLRYLFGCLLTALLVSFGAPFWNDILGKVSRLQKTPRDNSTSEEA